MDRRQRKTRQAIYAAFEELVEQEPYGSITVSQIIERADIGRSTFYAHFETKDELLQSMCVEMFDHIFEGVNAQCVTHRHLEASDAKGRLAHLLYHLRDAYGSICGKLLKEGEPLFAAYFRNQLAGAFELDPPRLPDGMPEQLANGMLVSAFCEAVVWWFEHNTPCEPEQLAEWFLRMMGDPFPRASRP